MIDNAIIDRSGGSLAIAPLFGSPVYVNYTGSAAINTGYELPTNSSLDAMVDVSNGAGVTLTSTGGNTIKDLSLTSGNFAIDVQTLTIKGGISA